MTICAWWLGTTYNNIGLYRLYCVDKVRQAILLTTDRREMALVWMYKQDLSFKSLEIAH